MGVNYSNLANNDKVVIVNALKTSRALEPYVATLNFQTVVTTMLKMP